MAAANICVILSKSLSCSNAYISAFVVQQSYVNSWVFMLFSRRENVYINIYTPYYIIYIIITVVELKTNIMVVFMDLI